MALGGKIMERSQPSMPSTASFLLPSLTSLTPSLSHTHTHTPPLFLSPLSFFLLSKRYFLENKEGRKGLSKHSVLGTSKTWTPTFQRYMQIRSPVQVGKPCRKKIWWEHGWTASFFLSRRLWLLLPNGKYILQTWQLFTKNPFPTETFVHWQQRVSSWEQLHVWFGFQNCFGPHLKS